MIKCILVPFYYVELNCSGPVKMTKVVLLRNIAFKKGLMDKMSAFPTSRLQLKTMT